jgi:hypothetical protein
VELVLFTKYYYNNHIKEEMGRAWSMDEVDVIYICKILARKTEGKRQFQQPGIGKY